MEIDVEDALDALGLEAHDGRIDAQSPGGTPDVVSRDRADAAQALGQDEVRRCAGQGVQVQVMR